MARIATAELDRLKAAVSVAELVAADGVALTKRGADLVGLCPLHAEAMPSLVVTPAKMFERRKPDGSPLTTGTAGGVTTAYVTDAEVQEQIE